MMLRKQAWLILRGIYVLFFTVIFGFTSCNNQSNNNTEIEAALANAGKILEQKLNADVATYLDSAFAKFPNCAIKYRLNKYQILVRQYYYFKSNFPKALNYIDSMEQVLATLSPNDYKAERVFVLLHKSRLAMINQQFDDAFLYQYKAKLLIEELKDPCQEQQLSYGLAIILFKQEAYKDAAAYFTKSYTKGDGCIKTNYEWFFIERLMTPNNIGICYERLNMFDSAMYYYKLGLQNLTTDGVKQQVSEEKLNKTAGVYYGNLGGLLFKLNNVDSAKTYLEKSIALNYHTNMDINDAILTKIKLAQLQASTGEIIECKFLIKSIQADLINYPSTEAELRLFGVLSKYYKAVGDYMEADKYNTIEWSIRDSIKLVNRINGVKKSIVNEFDQAKDKVQLASFKHDDKIKTQLLTAAFVTLFFSFLILLIFAFSRKRNKKHIAKLEVLNKALSNTNQKLENSYADNERLIKVVAHDMRSPLVAVVGVLDLLCTEDIDAETRANLLKLAKESSQKGLVVLDDVLKAKANNQDLPKSLVSLKSIIESSVSVVNQSAINKNQTIIIDVADVMVNVNEGKIWRVLNNLLTNAIKFSYDGGKIEINSKLDTDMVTISVKDFGMGIPEKSRANLFDFFTEASRIGTNGEETHGLGLAISKQIIEAHKGKIWFESETNVGTTFFIQLPI